MWWGLFVSAVFAQADGCGAAAEERLDAEGCSGLLGRWVFSGVGGLK